MATLAPISCTSTVNISTYHLSQAPSTKPLVSSRQITRCVRGRPKALTMSSYNSGGLIVENLSSDSAPRRQLNIQRLERSVHRSPHAHTWTHPFNTQTFLARTRARRGRIRRYPSLASYLTSRTRRLALSDFYFRGPKPYEGPSLRCQRYVVRLCTACS